MTSCTPYEALEQCVEIAGSQSAMARDLSLSSTAVWKMINRAKRMSAHCVLDAERLYGVSRHNLRPDLYPREVAA
ncbi:MAG: YdaS family helix-turn-helix protein [Pseudomonadota bacterium]